MHHLIDAISEQDVPEPCDIAASYGADTITLEDSVRSLFEWNGQLWVSIGS